MPQFCSDCLITLIWIIWIAQKQKAWILKLAFDLRSFENNWNNTLFWLCVRFIKNWLIYWNPDNFYSLLAKNPHNTPLFPPKKFAYALFWISLRTSPCPRRNFKQWLCKFFGGVGEGVKEVYYGFVQVESGPKPRKFLNAGSWINTRLLGRLVNNTLVEYNFKVHVHTW